VSKKTATRLDGDKIQLDAGAVILGDAPDDKNPRRFRMLAHTGAKIERFFGSMVVDMSGVQAPERGTPILLGHNEHAIAGFADSIELTDEGLVLLGTLSEVTEAGREVAGLSDEGFPWQASVGLQVLIREVIEGGSEGQANGETFSGPLEIWRESRLLESSFVVSGADSATTAVALSAAQKIAEIEAELEALQAANTDLARDLAAASKSASDFEAALSTAETHTSTGDPVSRISLSDYMGAFPAERRLWAAERYAEEITLEAAKASLADELLAERAEAEAAITVLSDLADETRHPGVGFSGAAEGETETGGANLSPSDQEILREWNADEGIQAEFRWQLSAYLAWRATQEEVE